MKKRIFTKPLLKAVIPVALVASIAVWFLSPGVHSLFGCVFHSNIERKCYLYDYDTDVFSGETTFTLSGFGFPLIGRFYGNCSVSGYPTEGLEDDSYFLIDSGFFKDFYRIAYWGMTYEGEFPPYSYYIHIDKNDLDNIMLWVTDASADTTACFLSSDSDLSAKEQYEYWLEKYGVGPLSETESLEGSS